VELEELAAQPVARARAARVSTSALLAVAALGVLLAAGFGLLGGRSDGQTRSSQPASLTPSGVAVETPSAGASPAVVPSIPP
jgi:hypothetical protein